MEPTTQKITEQALACRTFGNEAEFIQLCNENFVPEKSSKAFWNKETDELQINSDSRYYAIEKIKKELDGFKGDRKAGAVVAYVAQVIQTFCKNEKFAEAVLNQSATISDCCSRILEDVGKSISDIETYRRAARFYFPGCKVEFTMSIITASGNTTGDMPEHLKAVQSTRTAPAQSVASKTPAQKKPVPKKEPAKKKEPKKQDDGMIQISLFD